MKRFFNPWMFREPGRRGRSASVRPRASEGFGALPRSHFLNSPSGLGLGRTRLGVRKR